jgi:hypothetical protein
MRRTMNETDIAAALEDLQETLRQHGVTPEETAEAIRAVREETPVTNEPPVLEIRPFKGIIMGVPMDPDDVPNGLITGKDIVVVRNNSTSVLKLTSKPQWKIVKERANLEMGLMFLEVFKWERWEDKLKPHPLEDSLSLPKGTLLVPVEKMTVNAESFMGGSRNLWDALQGHAFGTPYTPAPWATQGLGGMGIDYARETDAILREQEREREQRDRQERRVQDVERQRRTYTTYNPYTFQDEMAIPPPLPVAPAAENAMVTTPPVVGDNYAQYVWNEQTNTFRRI